MIRTEIGAVNSSGEGTRMGNSVSSAPGVQMMRPRDSRCVETNCVRSLVPQTKSLPILSCLALPAPLNNAPHGIPPRRSIDVAR